MMFQSYALFPHMTVFDNIAYGLRRDGLPKAEIQARVEELLQLVTIAILRWTETSSIVGWSTATRGVSARPREASEGPVIG